MIAIFFALIALIALIDLIDLIFLIFLIALCIGSCSKIVFSAMVAGFLRLDTELVQFSLYNILFEVSSESRLHHGLIGVYGCSLVLKCVRLCRQCSVLYNPYLM